MLWETWGVETKVLGLEFITNADQGKYTSEIHI